jgi:hypothetical protein
MSERVSQFVVLCEDEMHERLTKAYMRKCGLRAQEPFVRSLVGSKMQAGGNVGWVLNEFPRQLHACRQRSKKAKTLLIVVVDADELTVEDRQRQLSQRVHAQGHDPFGSNEPAVLLIPKRHIETWIRALLGETVTEDQDCKMTRPPAKLEVRVAAGTLWDWSRAGASLGPTCVPSLAASLPSWRRIG